MEEQSPKTTPASWGSMNTPYEAYIVKGQDTFIGRMCKKCEGYELPVFLLYVLYLTAIYCEFT